MNLILQGKLPVADWIEDLTNWLTHSFSGLFNLIQSVGNFIMDGITNTLLFVNPLLLIVLVTLAAFFLARKKWTLPTFTLLGLLFIYNQSLWDDLVNTFTLVLVSSLLCRLPFVLLILPFVKFQRN